MADNEDLIATIYVEHDQSAATEIPLLRGKSLRLGRAKSNDIVLNDKDVSRFHAMLSASSTGVVLCDLSSLNGTYVNGVRISCPVDLTSEDQLKFGNIKVRVQLHYGTAQRTFSSEETQLSIMRSVEVTILLADVCGYTKLSQAYPPEHVVQTLDKWFETAAEIVRQHNGEVDKYIGDCVMAVWLGSSEQRGTNARAAVKAALEIRAATKKLANSGIWNYQAEHPWDCRIALNSGAALRGTVRSKTSRDYSVLGDSVNVAFRLESCASTLGVDFILSDTTAALTSEIIELKSLGSVALEGREGKVAVFTLA